MIHTITHRTVAIFPLNGTLDAGGYEILKTENELGEFVHGLPNFTVIDHSHGYRVIAGFETFGEAIALCLSNAGWGQHKIEDVTNA